VLAAVVALLVAQRAGIHVYDLVRDPAAQFGFPVYGGLVSNVGVSVLTLAAGITGFAAATARRDRGRLAVAAVLSFLLAVDDQYALHERLGPQQVGLPETAFLVLYALTALGIVATIVRKVSRLPPEQRRRSRGRHLPLVIAGALLAFSIGVDQLVAMSATSTVVEDLAKLGGVVVWLVYWTAEAARAVRPETSRRQPSIRPPW